MLVRSDPPAWANTGDERIAGAFAAARHGGQRAALLPFAVGGFPSLDASRQIANAYADGGADILEIGIPCADPHADGPVIRDAGAAALRAGATVDGVLDVARTVSERVPVVVMCYASTVLVRGSWRFAAALADAGVSGLIVPDLPAGEVPALLAGCDAAGVALVPVVTPADANDDVSRIGHRARGFVYAVSVRGMTGERSTLANGASGLIRRAQARSHAPVALGFGISTPEHAAQAARAGADGVVVGSRLVRAAAQAADPPAAVRRLVAQMSRALTVCTVRSLHREPQQPARGLATAA
jgi:tryptophan synthase alpha chain